MIGYVTLGSNDLDKARGFYDALMPTIGAGRIMSFISWPNSRISYSSIADAAACISSIASSIDPISAVMALRSNGVRKVSRTVVNTSRMMSSASW